MQLTMTAGTFKLVPLDKDAEGKGMGNWKSCQRHPEFVTNGGDTKKFQYTFCNMFIFFSPAASKISVYLL